MTKRIVDPASPLSVHQQRLRYVDDHPERDWLIVLENVPEWPDGLPGLDLPPTSAAVYPPCNGIPALVDAIRERERRAASRELRHDQVLVTNGAFHALSLVARDVAGPRRVALCHAYVVESVRANLESLGFEVRLLPPGAESDPEVAAWAFAAPEVALAYLSSPSNPTGRLVTAEVAAELARVAAEARKPLVLDLVYDDFVWEPPPASPLEPLVDLAYVYTINSMSKMYGAPGLRIGWLVSAAANVTRLAGVLEHDCIAVSGDAQAHAAELLRHGNEELVASVAQGRARMLAALSAAGLTVAAPAGGTHVPYAVEVDDVEELADFLLEELGVVVMTSGSYADVDVPFLRLPFGRSERTTTAALERLVPALGARGQAPAAVAV